MSQLNDKTLFERALNIYREIVTLEQDLEALAAEFTFDKYDNVNGLDKAVVKKAMKASEVFARESVDKIEDKIAKEREFVNYYNEITE